MHRPSGVPIIQSELERLFQWAGAGTLATEIESEILETVGSLVSADIQVKSVEFALTKSDG